MPEKLDKNLSKLLGNGVAVETSPGGRTLLVSKLGFETAIKLGHALTVQLDGMHGGRGMYDPKKYTQEAALTQARVRLAASEGRVFGETRPAGRNLAVRVEQNGQHFSLAADVRNDYEDRPELNGGHILQLGFVAVLKTLDL